MLRAATRAMASTCVQFRPWPHLGRAAATRSRTVANASGEGRGDPVVQTRPMRLDRDRSKSKRKVAVHMGK